MIIKKTKDYYIAESKNLAITVSDTKLDGLLVSLCNHLGLDVEGEVPFTGNGADWDLEG